MPRVHLTRLLAVGAFFTFAAFAVYAQYAAPGSSEVQTPSASKAAADTAQATPPASGPLANSPEPQRSAEWYVREVNTILLLPFPESRDYQALDKEAQKRADMIIELGSQAINDSHDTSQKRRIIESAEMALRSLYGGELSPSIRAKLAEAKLDQVALDASQRAASSAAAESGVQPAGPLNRTDRAQASDTQTASNQIDMAAMSLEQHTGATADLPDLGQTGDRRNGPFRGPDHEFQPIPKEPPMSVRSEFDKAPRQQQVASGESGSEQRTDSSPTPFARRASVSNGADRLVRQLETLVHSPISTQPGELDKEAQRRRHYEIIRLANQTMALTHNNAEHEASFGFAARYLLGSRLSLALSGDPNDVQILMKDTDAIFRRDPSSQAAADAIATLQKFAVTRTQLSETQRVAYDAVAGTPADQLMVAQGFQNEAAVPEPMTAAVEPMPMPYPMSDNTSAGTYDHDVSFNDPQTEGYCYDCGPPYWKQYWRESWYGNPLKWCPPKMGAVLHDHLRLNVERADAAQMVMHDYDFEPGGSRLKHLGQLKLNMIAKLLPRNFSPVIVEQVVDNPQLSQARRLAVLERLAAGAFPVPEERVLIGQPIAQGLRGHEAEILFRNLDVQSTARGNVFSGGRTLSGSFGF